jgi:hypothetical protein
MIASDIAAASHRFKVDTIGVWAFDAGDQPEVRVRMRDLCAAIGAVEGASGTTSGALALANANVLMALPFCVIGNSRGTLSVLVL